MNLSLYLLLASENDIAPETRLVPFSGNSSAQSTGQQIKPVYDPRRPAGKALLQASFRRLSSDCAQPRIGNSLGFGVAVVANALGFLTMISGLMLLLQIAQASLV